MTMHRPAGRLADGGDPVHLTAEEAGWSAAGLRVIHLDARRARTVETGASEVAVLPLSVTRVEVVVDGERFERFELDGRASVFERVSDFVYVGRDSSITLTSTTTGEIALATARCEARLPCRYGAADAVPVEVRGAGPSTRQVTNFLSPDAWPHADRLMAVELLTPDGNWSSYPPHRHDDSPDCPVDNEEIYYFRIDGAGAAGAARASDRQGAAAPSVDGFGLHRLYTPDGDIDENVVVRDGDVFLIPRGYHGPCIAAPGYPMYYLNVLAGRRAGTRSMAFCDDPAHHWVRDTWDGGGMTTDPRCPMTSAAGPVGG